MTVARVAGGVQAAGVPSVAVAAYYDRLVDRYGHDPRACDYGSAASQAAKFRALAAVLAVGGLRPAGLRLLDVGCGFADYAGHLAEVAPGLVYAGVDLSPRMVAEARRLRPDLEIGRLDILEDDPPGRFDVVSANGIFYLLGDDAPALTRRLIARMWELAGRALAFNSLSAWAPAREEGEYYADPLETVRFCRTLTPWVVLRHDYLPHDFTVYLFRDRPAADRRHDLPVRHAGAALPAGGPVRRGGGQGDVHPADGGAPGARGVRVRGPVLD